MNRGVSLTRLPGPLLMCLALMCGCNGEGGSGNSLETLRDLRVELSAITRNSRTSWTRDVQPGAPLPMRILAQASTRPGEPLGGKQVRSILRDLRRGQPQPEPVTPDPTPQVTEPLDAPDWPAARRKLDLQVMGVSRLEDGSYSALLKSFRSIKKDDTLSAFYDNKTYTWQVLSVSESGLVHLKPLEVE